MTILSSQNSLNNTDIISMNIKIDLFNLIMKNFRDDLVWSGDHLVKVEEEKLSSKLESKVFFLLFRVLKT